MLSINDLVFGAGIKTRDLSNMSLLPLPLDQSLSLAAIHMEHNNVQKSTDALTRWLCALRYLFSLLKLIDKQRGFCEEWSNNCYLFNNVLWTHSTILVHIRKQKNRSRGPFNETFLCNLMLNRCKSWNFTNVSGNLRSKVGRYYKSLNLIWNWPPASLSLCKMFWL